MTPFYDLLGRFRSSRVDVVDARQVLNWVMHEAARVFTKILHCRFNVSGRLSPVEVRVKARRGDVLEGSAGREGGNDPRTLRVRGRHQYQGGFGAARLRLRKVDLFKRGSPGLQFNWSNFYVQSGGGINQG
jgi:hypothetical protein